MRPVSIGFGNIVRGSHQMCARARIVPPGQTGVDPDGEEIPVIGGDVSHDATAEVRSTLELTTDGHQWSTKSSGLITPYGSELFVERGLVHGNGDKEWVSQGYYRINTVEQANAPRGALRISAQDRMASLIDARLLSPYQVGQGVSVSDVMWFFVRPLYPDVQFAFDFDATAVTLGAAQVVERDRWGFLDDLVTSLGKVWYWDYAGQLRVQDPPSPEQPVWSVTSGEDGVLVTQGRSVTRDGVYNAVVAEGEVPQDDIPPVRAVAYDTSLTSPTRWGGPFGQVPKFYSSSMITTQEQARAAARSILLKQLGVPYRVDFSSVPHPGLEALDAVTVSSGENRGDEVHVLETITLPLTPDGAMTATTREQTAIEIEVE